MVQLSGSAPNNTLLVSPRVFKHHVAGHLEQLALFAAPTIAAIETEDSDGAVKEEPIKRTNTRPLPIWSPAVFSGGRDQTSKYISEEYRWIRRSCHGDNDCSTDAGYPYCFDHWRNTCCYVYILSDK
jgi:hypothetical protein